MNQVMGNGSTKAQKTVLMICGDYMDDFEAMVPFQALQAYGISVDAVCPGKRAGDKCPTGLYQGSFFHQGFAESPGHIFELNATFDGIEACKYDGLVIPGARAPEYLALNESVLQLARTFAHSGKPIASICHGSLILAAADLVKGRTMTAFPSLKSVLIDAGATWVPGDWPWDPLVWTKSIKDGNLVTGPSYRAHPEFISFFVETLGGTVSGADNKRVLFLCDDNSEAYELMVPFQALQALGCHVDAVSPKKVKGDTCVTVIREYKTGDQTYTEKQPGYRFSITESFEGLDFSGYDALVLPGGSAPDYSLSLNKDVLAVVKDFMDAKKIVAAIAHGQQILSAAADVLKGRKCTGHPTVKLNVVLAGATWVVPEPIDICFTDNNLITTASWHGHIQFISQLMASLGIKVSFKH